MKPAHGGSPATDAELEHILAQGLDALHLPLNDERVAALVRYLRLIEKWNAAYNLTAIRDPREAVTHHLLDCLAAAAALERRRGGANERVLDVGSGAGLPGIVLALVSPQRHITCIDSVGKKTAFITQASALLGLSNVTARHGRVEDLRGETFDVIASRAFASLEDFVTGSRHLIAPAGEWMAMKGRTPDAEVASLADMKFHVEPLTVPGLSADRCIVWMSE